MKVFAVTWTLVCIGLVIGWVMNVVALVHLLMLPGALVVTGMMVLRVVGIFVAPLGGIVGFF